MDKDLINKLKYLINKKKSVEEICEILEINLNELKDCLDYLKLSNLLYEIVNNNIVKITETLQKEILLQGFETFQICLISDLHLTSVFDRVDLLNKVYIECKRRGIKHIFCAGDLTNGFYPKRKEYKKHQKVLGFDETIDYVINEIPSYDGINLYTISGNHDETFRKCFESDILEKISQKRSDIIFLGNEQGSVNINGIKVELMHGTKLKGNCVLNRIERCYNSITNKPDILGLGHIHHSFYSQINHTHVLQNACLMDQTPYANTMNFTNEKSVYFLTVQIDKYGNIVRLIPELYDDKKLIRIKK